LIVLLFLTGPLQYLPNCVLASVVFLIGIELIDGLGLKRIRASGHMLEFGIAVITAATVVGWGVEQGIILAIVISVIAHLRRSYNPRNAVLGGAGRHDWQAVPVDPVPQVEPGLIVYRWGASLYFANAARFEEQVISLATENAACSWICIDGVALGDVDYTGGETLLETITQLKEHGVRLVFSGVGDAVRKELNQSGVTTAVGEDAFFADVEAVLEAHRAAAK